MRIMDELVYDCIDVSYIYFNFTVSINVRLMDGGNCFYGWSSLYWYTYWL